MIFITPEELPLLPKVQPLTGTVVLRDRHGRMRQELRRRQREKEKEVRRRPEPGQGSDDLGSWRDELRGAA